MTRYYKVTGPNGESIHGGSGRWTRGRWRSVRGEIVPCESGLHLCRADQLIDWLGPVIWEAEVDGEVVDAGDKVVARRARIVRRVESWNDRTARHFAADCAEGVLHLVDPAWRETIEVVLHTVRAYADGEATDEELAAARDAARPARAAWAARPAGDAARHAPAAAWAAARDARDAAWAAAWAAAWPLGAAAWDAQSQRLIALLGLEDGE